jgi:ABC-type transport system substrate-binding protein
MNVWPVEPGTAADGLAFFADQRVRQAVAYGTNRQQMTEEILFGEVSPLTSNLPSDHWAWNPETEGAYPFDPEQAMALLEEAGWVDSDGDGVREASSTLTGEYSCGRGSWSIPAGTPFEVAFHTTTGNAMRQQLSTIFQSNMADIGLQINLDLLPAAVWFADDGPLTTRSYQIGEFAWVTSPDPDNKTLYMGLNMYSTPDGLQVNAQTILDENPDLLAGTGIDEFAFKFGRAVEEAPDAAAHQFLASSLPEGYAFVYAEQIQSAYDVYEGQNNMGWCDPGATQAQWDGGNQLASEDRVPYYLEFQRIFAEQVPTLPLFQRVEVEAYSTNLCGPDRGPSNLASWNIETWYFAAPGESCE